MENLIIDPETVYPSLEPAAESFPLEPEAGTSPLNLISTDIGGYISQFDLNNENFNRPCTEITQSIKNNEQSKGLRKRQSKKNNV